MHAIIDLFMPATDQFNPNMSRRGVVILPHSWISKTTKKILTQPSHYCFEQRYFFGQKNATFLQKNADISKNDRAWALKGIFS